MSLSIAKISNKIANKSNVLKKEISDTKNYYTQNFKNGWTKGETVTKYENMSPLEALGLKLKAALTYSKIRKKDIPFIISIPTIPTPIPTLAVFAVAKLIPMVIKRIK